LTASEPIAITGTTHGITIAAGTAVAGSAGKAVIASDTTNGYLETNENNTGLARVCTATNGVCASGFPITLGSTPIAANSTTTTLTGFASVGSAVFAGTGSTQTVMNMTQGTAASAPPVNTIQFGAPTSVPTSYKAYLPSASPTDSGGDQWVVPSGGGTGSWKPYLPIQIAQTTVSSATTSVSFTSIPSTYTSLMIVFSGATAGTSEDTPQLQFNGDVGSHYDQAGIYTGTSYAPAGFGDSPASGFPIGGILPVYNSSTPFAGNGSCTISNYAGPFYKNIHCEAGGWQTSSSVPQLVNVWGDWRSSAAITSILFYSANGFNLQAGTTVTLYGLP
jgi:hypothetical protein